MPATRLPKTKSFQAVQGHAGYPGRHIRARQTRRPIVQRAFEALVEVKAGDGADFETRESIGLRASGELARVDRLAA